MVRGRLAMRGPSHVIVDCAGAGYRVAVPPTALLPPVGDEVTLYTHMHVREDSLALYGFQSVRELDVFELLLSCQGVGPKVALACLSVLSPDTVTAAVLAQDLDTLTRVPGIGKRSAEKLVFEMAPRLGADAGLGSYADVLHGEVRDALEGLGYGDKEIAKVLAELPEHGEVSALLRQALRILGGRHE